MALKKRKKTGSNAKATSDSEVLVDVAAAPSTDTAGKCFGAMTTNIAFILEQVLLHDTGVHARTVGHVRLDVNALLVQMPAKNASAVVMPMNALF